MPQPEGPAARSGAIQGSAYSESASNGASMTTPARSLYPKLAFFISLLSPQVARVFSGGATLDEEDHPDPVF